ncbi:hypothetical protein I3843_09G059500 [Carya illinoinensis]|uniref:Uncharacterized protein n=1 Tax=Carya illinoinensis TaxID=32201 RepID=A0A922J7B2_CARIL|nr:hypothetical protein I3760_09G058800 [Carya illinoinensis]KAG6694644.1 hypothetical protein I3842_09G059300 [Carya illinoinensis]KAG7962286.1 hypothetical protein I3843_09G059500 [Carya illinoinensis]
MSSQTVEHVVLFKAKDNADPSKINAWLDALNGLISLDQVLHLSAGPALRTRSSSSSLGFTHILHCRYGSERDLAAYLVHPSHVSVVKDHGQYLIDDIMAVDWLATAAHDLHPPPGSAIRVTFLKLKEDLGDDVKSEILAGIRGIKDRFGRITQFTFGENFSPGRAKGFSLAWLAVFPGRSDLESMDSNENLVYLKEQQKVKDFVSELVVDYVVPLPL